MLRIIHTADWHLGQTFHQYERDYEHSRFMEWLLGLLENRQPHVLLLSGDVFDSINPPASAQRRYFSFLQKARELVPMLQIVVTAGNHDSAARLEAPAALLEGLNISVVGTVSRGADGEVEVSKFIVPLRDEYGKVCALALAVPFLRPSDVPLIGGARDPYLDGIQELYRRVSAAAVALRDKEHPDAALIGMGHCHMHDASQTRDSERPIVAGGVEALSTTVFPSELAYVALGHLHRPQSLDAGRIWYSGSPIPLSFSEISYKHQVLEVTFEGHHLAEVRWEEVPRSVHLMRLPEGRALPLEELLERIQQLPLEQGSESEVHPFLEVRVLDDGPDPTRRRRIEEALEGRAVRLASLRMEAEQMPEAEANHVLALGLEDLRAMDPVEIMQAAYAEGHGCAARPDLVAALNQLIQEKNL